MMEYEKTYKDNWVETTQHDSQGRSVNCMWTGAKVMVEQELALKLHNKGRAAVG